MDCSMLGFPVHHQLLELTKTHVHQVSDAIQPSHPLSSPSPASIFPSIRVFSNESVLRIRWPKYWSFSFSISPSNEYSGLISVRIDWLDLLAVQAALKSLIQHRSSKASILQCSAFFLLLYPYMTTGKTIALTSATRDQPRLACECPGVSSGGVGLQWPAAWSGALSAAMRAWDLLKDITIIFITSTIVWPQVKQQGGNTVLPINRKLN